MARELRGPEAQREERGGDRLNFLGGKRLGVNEHPVTVCKATLKRLLESQLMQF